MKSSPRVGLRTANSKAELTAVGIAGDYFKMDPDETIVIQPGTVTVVIGDNLKARSELAEILAGKEKPRAGVINQSKRSRTWYVTPTIPDGVDKHATIRDWFLESQGLRNAEQRLSDLYTRLGDDPDNVTLMTAIGDLQTTMDECRFWVSDAEIEAIIDGLCIATRVGDRIGTDTLVGELSSGQTSKVMIGQAIFSRCDVIVMNDPSVHLDPKSKAWLASYLRSSESAVVVVTSDMFFAAEVAHRVVEITDTPSGYTIQCTADLPTFIRQRDRIIMECTKKYHHARKVIDKQRESVDWLRTMARLTSEMGRKYTVAKAELDRLQQRLESMPGREFVGQDRLAEVGFSVATPGGTQVLNVVDLVVSYPGGDRSEVTVVDLPALEITRGERIRVAGPNGSGKSTFLKALMAADDSLLVHGRIKLGPSVTSSYYSPEVDLPDRDITLRQWLGESAAPGASVAKILDYWGFGSAYYHRTLPELRSQDEIARLLLAKITAEKANLLVLDEPTSYLTPSNRGKLISSLRAYSGALILVSHDGDFVHQVGVMRELALGTV